MDRKTIHLHVNPDLFFSTSINKSWIKNEILHTWAFIIDNNWIISFFNHIAYHFCLHCGWKNQMFLYLFLSSHLPIPWSRNLFISLWKYDLANVLSK